MFSIVVNLVFPNKFSKTKRIIYNNEIYLCDLHKEIYKEFNLSKESELVFFKSDPESINSEVQDFKKNLEYERGDCILPKNRYLNTTYFVILEEMWEEIKNKKIERNEVKSLDQLEIIIKKDIKENLDKEYHDDQDFTFLEREKSIKMITENIEKMFYSFKNKSKSRSDHIFLTCLTGKGMGKTRLGIECLKYIESLKKENHFFNSLMKNCIYLKIDFKGGDKVIDEDIKYSPEIGLCKRLFSRSILGCSLQTSGLIDKISSNGNHLFTLKQTLNFIASKHRTDLLNPIAILLHLDEFQIAHEQCTKKYNKPEFIKEMIELLGFFRCSQNKSFADETNIFIIPFLTGTNPGPLDIELLKWDFENISINTLSLQSSKSIICSKLNCEIEELQHDLLDIILKDLGIVPRYLQKLIKYIKLYKNNNNDKTKNSTFPNKLIEVASSKLETKIRNKKFDYKRNTLECLLYHIVCGVEVSWETVMSGNNSIKEISNLGHIYLVQNSNSGFFNIIIPTVDLNLIATKLSMNYLSNITQYPPNKKFVGFSFEYITSIIIILKNDLLQKFKSIIVNLKDIFGDIIDNDIMIKLKQLYLVEDSSNWFYGLGKKLLKSNDVIEVFDDCSLRKIIAIEEPGYISLLCNDCAIFDIRLNFELESSKDNSKTNLMVVIKTYYTNSGKYITEDIVSNIYTTYQKMCKKYTKSIIIPIIISNYQIKIEGFPNYKEILIYHKDNIDGSFFGNLIHRVKNPKD
ncbi:hypothetical protein ACTFIW_012467 [Dictyostelium discoideum]